MCNAGCNRGSRVLFDITSGWSYRWVIRLLSPSAKTKHAPRQMSLPHCICPHLTQPLQRTLLFLLSLQHDHTHLCRSLLSSYITATNATSSVYICLSVSICLIVCTSSCLYTSANLHGWTHVHLPAACLSLFVSLCQSLSVCAFVSLSVKHTEESKQNDGQWNSLE